MSSHRVAMLSIVAGLAAGGIAPLALAAPPRSVDLSYAWPRGLELRYAMHTEVQQETASPYLSGGSEVITDSTLHFEVVSERRGDGEIRVTTETIKIDADMGALGEVHFDSENARDRRRADNPDLAPFTFMLGKSYTMTLTPAGEVKRLEGYRQHFDRMLSNVGDPAARMALQGSLNESMARAQLEQTWHVLPGDIVNVGDSWRVSLTQDVAGIGQVITDVTYTLESVEEDNGALLATITARGRNKMGRAVDGVRARISDSLIEGEITFAADLGLVLDMDMTSTLVFDVTGPGGSVQVTLDAATQLEMLEVSGMETTAAAPEPLAIPSPEPRRAATPPGASAPGGKPN